MNGELITRATVWVALAGYVAGLLTFLLSRGNRRADAFARMAWTTGSIALVVHVLCAYHFFHDWSHASALQETARLTSEVYGFYWSGGLYINFILMAAWCADAVWWWRGLENYRRRPEFISMMWYFFLLFIFFNATVVFESGILRWLGIIFTFAILIIGVRSMKRTTRNMENKASLWHS